MHQQRSIAASILVLTLIFSTSAFGTGIPSPSAKTRTVHVKAMMFKFVPDKINVRKGETLKLKITSKDGVHGFRISGMGVNYPIQHGKVTEVVLTPAAVGEIVADCSVYCGVDHKKMKLTINVLP
jgi:heme/copper-type cytochrome/quinol oxidase subunit 2